MIQTRRIVGEILQQESLVGKRNQKKLVVGIHGPDEVLQRGFGGRQLPIHAAAGIDYDADTYGRIGVALNPENRPPDSVFVDVEILLAQVLNPSSALVGGSDRNSADDGSRLALSRPFRLFERPLLRRIREPAAAALRATPPGPTMAAIPPPAVAIAELLAAA